jgi:hypothetical protein
VAASGRAAGGSGSGDDGGGGDGSSGGGGGDGDGDGSAMPSWASAILASLPPDSLDLGFSEYGAYASWVAAHHPETVGPLNPKS